MSLVVGEVVLSKLLDFCSDKLVGGPLDKILASAGLNLSASLLATAAFFIGGGLVLKDEA